MNYTYESLEESLNDKVLDIERLTNENDLLKDKVSYYENKKLQDLFQKHLNETVPYLNDKNEPVKRKVNLISDVYDILINSFKYTKS